MTERGFGVRKRAAMTEDKPMEKKQGGVFKLVENLKPVDPNALEAFEREMNEKSIPEIIREVEKRRLLAAESRHRQLEMPADGKPGSLQK